MSHAPYFPKYAKDWLTGEGTRLMTPEQRGAFDWLLCHAWLSDPPCTLPDDDAALARLSDLGRRWKTVGAEVRAQFQPFPTLSGRIYNPKQLEIWKEMQEHRNKRSAAGRKGNELRWGAESLFDRNAIAKLSPPIGDAGEDGDIPPVGEFEGVFDSLWRDYPRKRGREVAMRHFDAQVRSRSDLAALKSAIRNYRREIEILGTEERHTLHGSTFFNGRWKDYADGTWEAPKPPGPPAPVYKPPPRKLE